mgnify:CR=1 FL=1
MGCERDAGDRGGACVNPGLGLGANPNFGLYKEILDLYATLHFSYPEGSLNLKTVVEYTTDLLCKHGLKNINEIQKCAGIWIYPVRISVQYLWKMVNYVSLPILYQFITCTVLAKSYTKYGRKIVLLLGGKSLKDILKRWLYLK